MNDPAVDLLLKMIEVDPGKRISAKDALRHEFFMEEDGDGGQTRQYGAMEIGEKDRDKGEIRETT